MNTRQSPILMNPASVKNAIGVPLCAPDGFDIQAPGRPDIPEMSGFARDDEPGADLSRAAWNGAQAGFQVYQDWLSIINAYPSTQGAYRYISFPRIRMIVMQMFLLHKTIPQVG